MVLIIKLFLKYYIILFIILFSQFQVVVFPHLCILFYRSQAPSTPQWAERAEQQVGERVQSLPDDAQVGRCSVHLA